MMPEPLSDKKIEISGYTEIAGMRSKSINGRHYTYVRSNAENLSFFYRSMQCLGLVAITFPLSIAAIFSSSLKNNLKNKWREVFSGKKIQRVCIEEIAAKKIQTAFRANRAKLRVKTKEASYQKNPFYQEAIRKIDQEETKGLKENLENLSSDEFLSVFRYLLSRKDEEGRIVINREIQGIFEHYLIDHFHLKGSGFDGYDTFDVQGIAELIEYYKLVCPDLANCEVTTLFDSERKWDEIKNGEGERFFVEDITSDGKTIGHVRGLYVNYEEKIAYFFDSLGGHKYDLKEIHQNLGENFTVITGNVQIQKDSHNCMVFAVACMANIAQSSSLFVKRLQAIAEFYETKKEIVQETALLENIMMAQSMSLLQKYDEWISLVGKSSPSTKIKEIIQEFDEKVVLKIKKRKRKKEAESFRDVWIKILHEDRVFLSRVSNQLKNLRSIDGAIRLDQFYQKEQNFLADRMRLRVLYYMATKRS